MLKINQLKLAMQIVKSTMQNTKLMKNKLHAKITIRTNRKQILNEQPQTKMPSIQ